MASRAIQKWVFDEFASRLADVVEAMAGNRPAVSWKVLPSAPEFPEEGSLWWHQPLAPLPGAAWIAAGEDAWSGIGEYILIATGIENSELADRRSTHLEVLSQILSGVAQALTRRLEQEVTSSGGQESPAPASDALPNASWSAVTVTLGNRQVTMVAGFGAELIQFLDTSAEKALAAAADSKHSAAPTPTAKTSRDSQTFDLLLDVELPVSVSFGRAQVLLKDVLKLTTGSIIELDRAIVEPVDILVNQCVIARGEVVVVEGNFGVRIQHVVSRQERLTTLQ